MKIIKTYIVTIASVVVVTCNGFAGNEDRIGQAGANELLIQPWARSSGWGSANSALVRGMESFNANIAGLSFIKGTEINFSHSNWLKGSDIKIEAFGVAQKVGESGVIGLSVMSMNFGEIERTTVSLPDGGAGTFKPQFLNVGIAYSKAFSNAIHCGLTLRIISEAINDMKAQGLALDAGIQYVTGFNKERDDLKFGISLRNVGAPMKYDGDGLAFLNGTTNVLQNQRTDRVELPSLVNIGVSYDITLAEDHLLTPAATYISNSFIRDQFCLGIEYGFKKMFMLRGGYVMDKKDKNPIVDEDISALIGASGGVSVSVPITKSGKRFGVDYAYRSTKTFDGTHTIGIRLDL